jgi:hypothetical protein
MRCGDRDVDSASKALHFLQLHGCFRDRRAEIYQLGTRRDKVEVQYRSWERRGSSSGMLQRGKSKVDE